MMQTMDTLTDLIASPAGLAIKGALAAAFLDFAFGVFAAVRDGTFALDAVAAFVRKHLLGRVFPSSLLAIAAYYTKDTTMMIAAGAALAAYTAETLASIYDSIRPAAGAPAEANPIPID
jgi:hypothetical protein